MSFYLTGALDMFPQVLPVNPTQSVAHLWKLCQLCQSKDPPVETRLMPAPAPQNLSACWVHVLVCGVDLGAAGKKDTIRGRVATSPAFKVAGLAAKCDREPSSPAVWSADWCMKMLRELQIHPLLQYDAFMEVEAHPSLSLQLRDECSVEWLWFGCHMHPSPKKADELKASLSRTGHTKVHKLRNVEHVFLRVCFPAVFEPHCSYALPAFLAAAGSC